MTGSIDWKQVYAAVWRQQRSALRAVQEKYSAGRVIFLSNALLWGARGTGKSSLIKAIFNEYKSKNLRLIEVYKNDLSSLPEIVDDIRRLPFRFIVYCDDFSFGENENTYVVLKTILEGSIEAPPDNAILYVTSNRRHLLPEYMKDNRWRDTLFRCHRRTYLIIRPVWFMAVFLCA